MKKLSILILIVVFGLVGMKAHANEDGMGMDGGLNAGVNIGIGGQGSGEAEGGAKFKLRDRNIANTPSLRGDIKGEMEVRRGMDGNEDKNDDKGGLRAELKTNMGLHLGEVMRNMHERAKVRFEICIDRLTKLQARIQSRIDKVKAEGKDTASAQASLDLSKSKLAEGQSFTAQAKVIIDAHTTVTPKTELSDAEKAQVKDLLEKAKVSLKASLEAMKESLRALIIIS